MDDDARRELGMQARVEVLGEAVAAGAMATVSEFNADFRDLSTRYAWGEVWSRPGLDRRTRSAVTIGALTALGQEAELAIHVKAAINNGLTAEEIKEALMHL